MPLVIVQIKEEKRKKKRVEKHLLSRHSGTATTYAVMPSPKLLKTKAQPCTHALHSTAAKLKVRAAT